MKIKNERAITASSDAGRGRKVFAKAALLGAGLAIAGCGDTINNYYYTGADGGASPDALQADSMGPDSAKADACVAKSAPLACSDKAIVSGVVNAGESLVFGDYSLRLDDIQVVGTDKPAAAVALLDSCGNELQKTKIVEGQAKVLAVGGSELEVSASEVMPGYTFGAKWANLSVKSPCEPSAEYWCVAVAGVLNQGESISIDSIKIRLDDLEVKGTFNAAIISVLDASDNILSKAKIPEASSMELNVGGKSYLVSVKTVAPGYTFGAKWAEIEVSGKKGTPCGS